MILRTTSCSVIRMEGCCRNLSGLTRMLSILTACLAAIVALPATTSWSDDEVVFAPRFSDYAVTFAGKPTIEEFETVTADGDIVKGWRAEFRAPDCFQRVDVIAMRSGFSLSETRESAISKIKEYAFHNGLRAPEFRWEVTPIGKRLSMRATKVLDDNGKPRAVTFEAIVHYGRSSLFTVYVGGLSESYPPTRVVKFLSSVQMNENKQ